MRSVIVDGGIPAPSPKIAQRLPEDVRATFQSGDNSRARAKSLLKAIRISILVALRCTGLSPRHDRQRAGGLNERT
jgi:hypothetical protein